MPGTSFFFVVASFVLGKELVRSNSQSCKLAKHGELVYLKMPLKKMLAKHVVISDDLQQPPRNRLKNQSYARPGCWVKKNLTGIIMHISACGKAA